MVGDFATKMRMAEGLLVARSAGPSCPRLRQEIADPLLERISWKPLGRSCSPSQTPQLRLSRQHQSVSAKGNQLQDVGMADLLRGGTMLSEERSGPFDQNEGFVPPRGWPFSSEIAPEFQLFPMRGTEAGSSASAVEFDNATTKKGLVSGDAEDCLAGSAESSGGPQLEEVLSKWPAGPNKPPLYLSSAVQSTPPTQKQDNSQKDNYYINVGYAVRTLREELPYMFYRKMTFDIYRDDITFKDPMNQFNGIESYKMIFWSLRFHGRIFFRTLWVDVQRIWQPCDKVIMVRWTVRGIPRIPWEAQGHFDGTSEYRLDNEGKIYAHKVDNVIMSSSRFQPIKVPGLVMCPGTPSYFRRMAENLLTTASYIRMFTWVRLYMAMRGTLALNAVEKAVLDF